MNIAELAKNGKFVITAEVGPPKGVDIKEMLEDAELMRGRVDVINVTDQQSSVMRLGSLATCRLLQERGLEPALQITCRDRNRIALQSDLLSANVLGIENILCLTGDFVSLGDHPQAKEVFDLDSVSLLYAAKELEKVVGEDYFERLMKRAREIQGELIFEMEERYGDSISDKTTDEIISRIKEKQQRQSVTRLQKMIVEAEQSGDEARLNELLREFNETLQDLNKGV